MIERKFIGLAMLFVTCLLIANIIAVKILALPLNLIVPAGILVFPLSYAINDVVSELYGFATMRSLILLGFQCNLVAVLVILLAGFLHAAPFWQNQQAYNAILGFTPRLLVASFAAYLIGETVNSWVFVCIKRLTNSRFLWIRAIGSTAIGEALDTVIFILIAFTGIIPGNQLIVAMLTQWLVKVAYEAIATPFTYAAVRYLRRAKVGSAS